MTTKIITITDRTRCSGASKARLRCLNPFLPAKGVLVHYRINRPYSPVGHIPARPNVKAEYWACPDCGMGEPAKPNGCRCEVAA